MRPDHTTTPRGLSPHTRSAPYARDSLLRPYHAGRIWSQPAHNLTVVLPWQEEASFITGVHLPVDGGLTIQLQDDFARKVLDHHAAASKL